MKLIDSRSIFKTFPLFGLITLSLLSLCTLSWQAFNAATQHQLIANKVLAEYASLATEEFSRRIMADIGFRGYYQTLNQWKALTNKQNWTTLDSKEVDDLCRKQSFAQHYFIKQTNQWFFVDQQCQLSVSEPTLQTLIQNFDLKQLQQKPFGFVHSQINQQPVSILISTDGEQNLIGYVINRHQLKSALTESFTQSALLPKVLAEGNANNHNLTINMRDHQGRDLLGNSLQNKPLITAQKILNNEYSGIFKQHTITVGIHPDNAEQLIIGGVPGNNLPIILLTILIVFIVFILSVKQIQKGHQLNQLRENFVAEVSHELRTPLTQIRMFAEMLEQGKTRNQQEFQHYLQVINREAVRLSYLIENILKYSEDSKIQALSLTPIQTDLVIHDVIADFKLLFQQKNIQLKQNLIKCEILANSHAFKQVISNLLDNAIKYGPENQTITLNSTILDNQRNHIFQLSICDQGKGIPTKQKPLIWSAYHRLERESEDAIAGTGIGLYLVKQLMAKMNAEIWVEDNQPCGCCFTLQWPLNHKDH